MRDGRAHDVPLTLFREDAVHARRRRALWLCLLCVPLAAVWVVVLWPETARRVSLLLDEMVTMPIPTPPVKKIAYDGDFRIGDLSLTDGTLSNYPFSLTLCSDASHLVIVKTDGHSFVLGPQTNPVDPSGRPGIDFVPERGDMVSLTARRSLVGWPTPFEVNWMTRAPSWKRYVYYRLIWKKRSGAELSMFWRYEQDYFSGRGWTRPVMMWDGRTGLLRVGIHRTRQDQEPRGG